MSVHSSPNPVATLDSRNHLLDPLGFTTTHFYNFSNVLSDTGTINDDLFSLNFSARAFIDNFQGLISGLTIPNHSNTQPMSPMVQGPNDMSSSFLIKSSSQTAMNGQMMSASNMLDNFEPDSTPHAMSYTISSSILKFSFHSTIRHAYHSTRHPESKLLKLPGRLRDPAIFNPLRAQMRTTTMKLFLQSVLKNGIQRNTLASSPPKPASLCLNTAGTDVQEQHFGNELK
ncbi:hypothetical protein M422DRAFT_245269 [Sphaerobolus stellatus SS14]|nr:hypothetical protein M422DRAFT_245269 [Sphaerobolus stellatus SS14]